jgi:hypothetical protein
MGRKKDMSFVTLSIALIISTVVGAFMGLLLGGFIGEPYIAFIAGLLATVFVGNARNIRTPQLAVIFSAIDISGGISLRAIIGSAVASIVGSVAAVQVARISELTWPVTVGALAGLFAGILMAMFMMYGMTSRPEGQSRPGP